MDEMKTDTGVLDLTGKLLVAMPGMGDPRFDRSVILLCVHSDDGAMGLILNKPSAEVGMTDVLDQLDIDPVAEAAAMPVHIGGPVEMGRGFVLHSREYESRLHTLEVPGGYGMTATLDILEDIARGAGPEKALMMLGYAGWAPGQLEDEIGRNGWLTADASPKLVFGTPAARKWEAALASLGIDPLGLSSAAGHA
ncbi:YqgE/AlgH family protein [Sulfitobacter sp. D35]|uniref:YqgE/AlgH family protein n=1 Tax=Sulfitobacter sp. D35 TaxID=3083252 RepID=UPI00296EB274|nr:YqgE/AlgH family protein [Sulfitobacter sp. D35]MDW4499775.1 YqgE/AlgH family protein [Sulfitobacter sp. D35]